MKIFYYIIILLSTAGLVFSALKVDFAAPLTGDSRYALICLLVGLCAIMLSIIMLVSLKIKERYDGLR